MAFTTGNSFIIAAVHTGGNDFAISDGGLSVAVAFSTDAVDIVVQALASLPATANDFTVVSQFTSGFNFTVGTLENSPAIVAFTTDDVAIDAHAVQPITAAVGFTTDDVAVAVSAVYDSAVWRGLTASTRAAHQPSAFIQIQGHDGWRQPDAKRPAVAASWQASETLHGAKLIDAGGSVHPLPASTSSAFQEAETLNDHDVGLAHRSLPQKHQATRDTWDAILAKGWSIRADWLNPRPKRIHHLSPWEAATAASLARTLGSNQAPRKLKYQRRIPWQQANPHNWIIGWPVIVPPVTPRVWPTDLIFSCIKPAWVDGLTTDLIFKATGCPWDTGQTPIIVPVLRSYFVSNSATVVTLPDLIPLDVTQINIGTDIDSWCWTVSATLPTSRQLALIAPVAGLPVEIRVTINGVVWEFAVEGYGDNRVFGKTGLTIKGRSKSAYLAEPYAPIGNDSNALDILAHQIADLAVLDTGFNVDWQVTDWLVLAGAWNHRGTPLARLTTLAESIGGSVQSATQAQTLQIVKRYPVLPWAWAAATPYAVIPPDAILGQSEDWSKKPDYNAVYVSGEAVGVAAQVKRTGTAANIVAPMAVSSLITHADAARMRGESILADTGAQGAVSITLALDATLGMVPPGKLIEIQETTPWRGLTRGVAIAAIWQDGQGLTVRQHLEMERHYNG